jgi:hypothetical protein
LQVSLASKQATIINLTLTDDPSPRGGCAEHLDRHLQRGRDQRQESDRPHTSEFINERLIIIEKELGSVDKDIEVSSGRTA